MAAFHRFEDLHMTAASVSVDEDPSQLDQMSAVRRPGPPASLHPLFFIGTQPQTAQTSGSSATVSPASATLSARLNCSNATRSAKATSTGMHVNEGQIRGSDGALAEPALRLAKASLAEQMHDVSCQSLEDRICNAVRAAVQQVMLEATAQLRATAAELQRQHAHCCGGRDIAGCRVADWRADLQEVLEEFRNKLLKSGTLSPSQGVATPSRWPRKASPQRDSFPKPESRDSSVHGRQRASTGDACTEEELRWLVNNLGVSRKRTASEEFTSHVIVNPPASMPASTSVPASSEAVSASIPRRSGCSPVDDSRKKSWPGLPETLAARRASVAAPPPLSRSQPAIPVGKSRLGLTSNTPPLSAYSFTPPLSSGQRLGGSLQPTARQHLR